MDDGVPPPPSTVDPRSGFCRKTKTFHSLRPAVALPSLSQPLSVTSYAFSLLLSQSPSSSLPTHPALIDATSGASLSYPVLYSQVHSLAAALHSPEIGLSRGDVAFVLSPSSIDIPVLYLALLSIGAVVCPSNPSSNLQEISHQFDLSSPSLAFATSSTAHLIPRHVPTVLLDSAHFRSLLDRGGGFQSEVHQSDTAAILFSSGTTGLAKAVPVTHRNYVAQLAEFDAERQRPGRATRWDVTVQTAPMFHTMGFLVSLVGLMFGVTMVVITGRPDLAGILRVAEKYRATMILAAPPIVVGMSKLDEGEGIDLRALRSVLTGSAPITKAVAMRFRSRLPWVALIQGYGMTEAGNIARMITPEECQHHRSVGRLAKNFMAKIVDPISGEALSVGLRGEIRLKGPVVMKGYLGPNGDTISTFDDGWFRTGDLCYFDHDGYLYIVDRLKELIKYKGYQVPPAELEQLLSSHPDIVDAAVVPYPHEEAGEIPMAFIVRQPGSTITESQIMDFVGTQVAPYKKIRKVAFINAIPKNPSGKILRKELVSLAISGSISRL